MLETVLIPAHERNSRRLLMVLHGLGDSVAGYQWLPVALQLRWLNYLLVNAPDPYSGGFSWFDFMGNPGPDIARSRGLLFELLEAQRKKGFAPETTMLFGFSQGGLMALEVGLRYEHRVAGVIGVSGYVHEPEQALKELSRVAREQHFFVTHGTQDTLIPLHPVRQQIQLLQAAGLNLAWQEFEKGHTIIEEEMIVIGNFVRARFDSAAAE